MPKAPCLIIRKLSGGFYLTARENLQPRTLENARRLKIKIASQTHHGLPDEFLTRRFESADEADRFARQHGFVTESVQSLSAKARAQ